MRVDVLVLGGVFDLGLSAFLDTLALANGLSGQRPPPLEVSLVGVRRRVQTHHGLVVPVVASADRPAPDVVMLPALAAVMPEPLLEALGRRDVADARELLRRWVDGGARVLAACGGTFILAGSGLLDGGAATTTWWLAPLFRERFPEVELNDTRMVVESGRCVTAGAALSHVDLALWLVRRISPELASRVARYLVLDPRPSPAAHAIPDQLAHADPIVERFERWARDALSEPFSLAEAAKAVATSPRTLSRRTNQVLGKSPVAYVHDLRVERAVHLLRTTAESVDEIASQVGYADGITLRNLLRRKTGRGVRELRARDWARD